MYLNLTETGRDKLTRLAERASMRPGDALERLLCMPFARIPHINHPKPLFSYKDIKCEYSDLSMWAESRLETQAQASNLSKSDYVELLLLLVNETIILRDYR